MRKNHEKRIDVKIQYGFLFEDFNPYKKSNKDKRVIIPKSRFLACVVFLLSGCINTPEKSSPFDQKSYDDFIQTIPFADSFDQAIRDIAEKNFQKDTIIISLLAGGMTSTKIFLITMHEKKYILRTLNPKHDRTSKKNEILAHTYAAHMGFAPPLTYVDPNLRFMIMPYVDGHTLNADDLRDQKVLKKIGCALALLHRYRGEFNQNKPQTYRTKKHLDHTQKKEIALPSLYKELYELYDKEGIKLNKNEQDKVLCHGDLNPANIIVAHNGSIFFIDWTSATWDNRYTDLGYFSFLNGLNDAQSRLLLESYLGKKATDHQWKMLKNAQKRTSFLTATVWFDFSESERDKLISKNDRIKNLDYLLNDAHLKTGIMYTTSHEVVSLTSGETEAIRLYALGFLKTYSNWKN